MSCSKCIKLTELCRQAELVIEDFMPNIGQCALQDYGRLNTVLIALADLRREQPVKHKVCEKRKKEQKHG